MKIKYSYNYIDSKVNKINSLYNKFILNPLAKVIVFFISNFTKVKPYQITIFGTLLAIFSSYLFYNGKLIYGAIIFQLTEILDGCDGLLARVRSSESIFGIILDYYTDVFRLTFNIIGFSLFLFRKGAVEAGILTLIFLGLNFSESFIDISYLKIKSILEKRDKILLSKLDEKIISIKKFLEKRGLKVNMLHYHERIFFVLFLAPIIKKYILFSALGIILVLFSIHLKLLLDIAIVKDHLINKGPIYLRTLKDI